MSGRTYGKDAIVLAILMAVYLLLFGCFRAAHFEHYPQCGSDVPCQGHERQVYCRDGAGGKWTCCRCAEKPR